MHLWQSLLLLLISFAGIFFFAGIEIGFISWNPIKIAHRAGQGYADARWALYLIDHKNRVLSTILICGSVSLVGATLSFNHFYQILDSYVSFDLERIPSPESWFLTPLIIVFAELLPKSLFRIYSFQLTMRFVPLLVVSYFITIPVTGFSSLLQKFTTKHIVIKNPIGRIRRDEMAIIASLGTRSGTLFESAKEHIDTILKLKDRTVYELMTPKEEWLRIYPVLYSDETFIAARSKMTNDEQVVFARNNIPEGYIGIFDSLIPGQNEKIHSVTKLLPRIHQDASLLSIIGFLSRKKERFFLVVNQQNQPVGLLDKTDVFTYTLGGISPVHGPTY